MNSSAFQSEYTVELSQFDPHSFRAWVAASFGVTYTVSTHAHTSPHYTSILEFITYVKFK